MQYRLCFIVVTCNSVSLHYCHFYYCIDLLFIRFANADITAVNCTALKQMFAEANSEFSLCAIESSRPIKLCEVCVYSYVNVVNSYKNMSQVIKVTLFNVKNNETIISYQIQMFPALIVLLIRIGCKL